MTDLHVCPERTPEECVRMCTCVCTDVRVCVCVHVSASGQNYHDVDHMFVLPDLGQTPLPHPPLDTKEAQ